MVSAWQVLPISEKFGGHLHCPIGVFRKVGSQLRHGTTSVALTILRPLFTQDVHLEPLKQDAQKLGHGAQVLFKL